MSQYVTYAEFLNSPYGSDYQPGESIFADTNDIDNFLTSISSLVDMYCGRTFDVIQYTQEFTDIARDFVYLDVIPVTGIVTVTYENFDGSSSGVLTGFRLNKVTGKAKFANCLNPNLVYKVTYVAGYDVVPQPIIQATLMWANIAAQQVDNGAVAVVDGGTNTQFRFNKFWEAYSDPRQRQVNDIPPTVAAILSRYKYLKR